MDLLVTLRVSCGNGKIPLGCFFIENVIVPSASNKPVNHALSLVKGQATRGEIDLFP